MEVILIHPQVVIRSPDFCSNQKRPPATSAKHLLDLSGRDALWPDERGHDMAVAPCREL